MESKKVAHLLYVPFTGLGLYGGYRGRRWLKNRLQIFRQFVYPSLLYQTNRDFVLWFSWRWEERTNPLVQDFVKYMESTSLRVVHTYSGVCFWDDKYSDDVAYERFVSAIHGSMGTLLNVIGEVDEVLMTIQPSDDVYNLGMVENVQEFFKTRPDINVYGYQKGYVMDYLSGRLAEWNPKTTPPFYTIRFPRETFADPNKHLKYTGPYKSHEYVKDYLKAYYEPEKRGFVVGTHGSNISTVFDHPYAGHEFLGSNIDWILAYFGLQGIDKLKPYRSTRSDFFNALPYRIKRKLRYWAERGTLFSWIYNFLRS